MSEEGFNPVVKITCLTWVLLLAAMATQACDQIQCGPDEVFCFESCLCLSANKTCGFNMSGANSTFHKNDSFDCTQGQVFCYSFQKCALYEDCPDQYIEACLRNCSEVADCAHCYNFMGEDTVYTYLAPVVVEPGTTSFFTPGKLENFTADVWIACPEDLTVSPTQVSVTSNVSVQVAADSPGGYRICNITEESGSLVGLLMFLIVPSNIEPVLANDVQVIDEDTDVEFSFMELFTDGTHDDFNSNLEKIDHFQFKPPMGDMGFKMQETIDRFMKKMAGLRVLVAVKSDPIERDPETLVPKLIIEEWTSAAGWRQFLPSKEVRVVNIFDGRMFRVRAGRNYNNADGIKFHFTRIRLRNGIEEPDLQPFASLTVVIHSVNDAPIWKGPIKASGMLHTVAESKSSEDLVLTAGEWFGSMFSDADTTTQGSLAVLGYKNNSIGKWLFSKDGVNFEDIPLVEFEYDRKNVILLEPDAKLKFEPNRPGGIVGKEEGLKAALYVLGNDNSNQSMSSVDLYQCDHVVCGPGGSSPLSEAVVGIIPIKVGCALVIDACGVCGGDNSSCKDCNGEPEGDAYINRCGECVMGTTGRADDYGEDCAGLCNVMIQQIVGQDQGGNNVTKCLRSDIDLLMYQEQMKCQILDVSSMENECGICVGGQTGNALNAGMDACDVCNGDNSTCTDCDGTINGPKLLDKCKQCRLPGDQSFNDCTELYKVSPTLLGATGDRRLRIMGVGFGQMKVQSVVLLHAESNTNISLTLPVNVDPNDIVATIPNLDRNQIGSYIGMVFFENADLDVVKKVFPQNVKIIPYPDSLSIDPSSASIGAVPKVRLADTYVLANSDFIRCFYLCEQVIFGLCPVENHVILIPANRIDNYTIECDLPSIFGHVMLARTYAIGVLLERQKDIIKQLPTAEFTLNAPAPVLDSLKFGNSMCMVIGQFDVPVQCPSDCSAIFASVAALGNGPMCKCALNNLHVRLGAGFTLNPSDSLEFKNNVVQSAGAINAGFFVGTVTVGPADQQVTPSVKIYGPTELGQCATTHLFAAVSDMGCLPLTLAWSVLPSGGDDSAITTDKNEINTQLSSLPAEKGQYIFINNSDIVAGQTYTYKVSLKDQSNTEQASSTIDVSRTLNEKPIRLHFRKVRNVIPFQPLKVSLVTSLVETCGSFELPALEYEISSNSPDIVIETTSLPYIVFITNIQSGSTIELSGKVFGEGIDTVTTSMTLHVDSLPLKARIQGPNSGSVEDPFTLKAILDDDQSAATTYYSWTCSSESLGVCFFDTSVLGTEATLTVEGNKLQPNIKYTIKVSITKDNRQTEVEHDILLSISKPPEVSWTRPSISINPTYIFFNMYRFTCRAACTVSVECAIFDGNEFVGCDLLMDFPPGIFGQESYPPVDDLPLALQMKPPQIKGSNVQEWVPGKYRYKVTTCYDESGICGYGIAFATVNPPPVLLNEPLVTPTTGTEFVTEFTCNLGIWDEIIFCNIFMRQQGESEYLTMKKRVEGDDYSFSLRRGIHKLKVVCFNKNGASTAFELPEDITVTEATTEQKQEEINNLRDVLLTDPEKATEKVKVLLLSAPNEVPQEIKSAVVQNQVDSIDVTKESVENIVDAFSSMADLLKAGVDKETLSSVLQKLLEFLFPPAPALRRKRETGNGGTLTPLTEAEAESLLVTLISGYSNKTEPDLVAQDGQDFTAAISGTYGFGRKICAHADFPYESPAVIKADALTLQVEKRYGTGLANQTYNVSCADCPSYVTNPAYVTYGQDIENSYTTWNCSGTTCTGLCLVSGQLSKDFVSAMLLPENRQELSPRRSDIVLLEAFYPSDPFTQVDPRDVLTMNAVEISVAVAGDVDLANYSLECLSWSGQNWTKQYCSSGVLNNQNSINYVTCQCMTFGYIAVFEGAPELMETTTMIPENVTDLNVTMASDMMNFTDTMLFNMSTSFDFSMSMSTPMMAMSSEMWFNASEMSYSTQMTMALSMPPLESMASSMPPLESMASSMPPLESMASSIPPLESLASSVPPPESMASSMPPLESMASSMPPLESMASSMPPLETIALSMPPLESMASSMPPLESMALSMPPPESMASSMPPLESMASSIPPPESMASSMPPLESLASSVPPLESVALSMPPLESMASSMPPLESMASSMPPLESMASSMPPPESMASSMPPLESMASSMPPPESMASSMPPLESMASSMPPLESMASSMPPLESMASSMPPLESMASSMPPLESMASSMPPLESMASSMPPLESIASSMPPLESMASSMPPLESMASSMPPLESMASSMPPLESMASSMPPLESMVSSMPPPESMASSMPPLESMASSMPPLDSMASSMPPLDSMASSMPPLDSMASSMPPLESMVSSMPPPESMASSMPPPESMASSMPPLDSMASSMPPLESMASSMPPPESMASSMPPLESMASSMPPLESMASSMPPLESMASSMPPPESMASSMPPLDSMASSMPPLESMASSMSPPESLSSSMPPLESMVSSMPPPESMASSMPPPESMASSMLPQESISPSQSSSVLPPLSSSSPAPSSSSAMAQSASVAGSSSIQPSSSSSLVPTSSSALAQSSSVTGSSSPAGATSSLSPTSSSSIAQSASVTGSSSIQPSSSVETTASQTTTTTATQTTTTTATTTTQMSTEGKYTVNAKLTFNNSYDVYTADPEGFKSSFQESTASALNISKEQVQVQGVTEGSIIVSFIIIQSSSQSVDAMNTLLADLKTAVENGTIVFTTANGTVLNVDISKFEALLKAPTAAKEEEKSNNKVVIIVVVVVGVVVVAAVVVLIVVIIKKKQSSGSARITPSPAPPPPYDNNVEEKKWIVNETSTNKNGDTNQATTSGKTSPAAKGSGNSSPSAMPPVE